MYAKRMRTKPMTQAQVEQAEKEIIQIYLYLISRTNNDPIIIEIMKRSALSDVHRRYKSEEPWSVLDGLGWGV